MTLVEVKQKFLQIHVLLTNLFQSMFIDNARLE